MAEPRAQYALGQLQVCPLSHQLKFNILLLMGVTNFISIFSESIKFLNAGGPIQLFNNIYFLLLMNSESNYTF